jgi:hypothetical protein
MSNNSIKISDEVYYLDPYTKENTSEYLGRVTKIVGDSVTTRIGDGYTITNINYLTTNKPSISNNSTNNKPNKNAK